MLESTDEPIESIALEVAYKDAGFFSRLFKRNVNFAGALLQALQINEKGAEDRRVGWRGLMAEQRRSRPQDCDAFTDVCSKVCGEQQYML
jgi:hypothetical protein